MDARRPAVAGVGGRRCGRPADHAAGVRRGPARGLVGLCRTRSPPASEGQRVAWSHRRPSLLCDGPRRTRRQPAGGRHRRGTCGEPVMGEVDARFGLRFAAAGLPDGESPGVPTVRGGRSPGAAHAAMARPRMGRAIPANHSADHSCSVLPVGRCSTWPTSHPLRRRRVSRHDAFSRIVAQLIEMAQPVAGVTTIGRTIYSRLRLDWTTT